MVSTYKDRLLKHEWEVRRVIHKEAEILIKKYHYSKGCSKTSVFCFGLFKKGTQELLGVTMWIPPMPASAKSLKVPPNQTLSLSRMAVSPACPKNTCTFLLSKSVKEIRKDGRFKALVTYADEYAGHKGGVYKASGWEYKGATSNNPTWTTDEGRIVSIKAGRSRSVDEMLTLGYINAGRHLKHKYVLYL